MKMKMSKKAIILLTLLTTFMVPLTMKGNFNLSANDHEITINQLDIDDTSKRYAIQTLDTSAKSKYYLKVNVNYVSSSTNEYYFGLIAGQAGEKHQLDFLYRAQTSEIETFATYYGKTSLTTLGSRPLIDEVSLKSPVEFLIIRDGEMFYFALNGQLSQTRRLFMLDTIPGFNVYGCRIRYQNLSYNDDETFIDSEIERLTNNIAPLAHGEQWANYSAYSVTNNGFTINPVMKEKTFTYGRVGYQDQWYTGDLTVQFDTQNLAINSAYENAGTKYPKLAFAIYNENGYADYLAYGAAKKQNRIESFCQMNWEKWYNHTSLEQLNNREQLKHFVIKIIDGGATKSYQVYVNDVLAAVRTSHFAGPYRLGWACEYISGEVSNIRISQGATL